MSSQRKIILTTLIISILLMLIKFLAYFITDSNAILTDASESIVNVLASAFAFYSIYLTTLPKDENHPYGHGRVEILVTFDLQILNFVLNFLNMRLLHRLNLGANYR